eukprot:scaffold62014_cov54-Phaeocystis_antarctica.AAC.3
MSTAAMGALGRRPPPPHLRSRPAAGRARPLRPRAPRRRWPLVPHRPALVLSTSTQPRYGDE